MSDPSATFGRGARAVLAIGLLPFLVACVSLPGRELPRLDPLPPAEGTGPRVRLDFQYRLRIDGIRNEKFEAREGPMFQQTLLEIFREAGDFAEIAPDLPNPDLILAASYEVSRRENRLAQAITGHTAFLWPNTQTIRYELFARLRRPDEFKPYREFSAADSMRIRTQLFLLPAAFLPRFNGYEVELATRRNLIRNMLLRLRESGELRTTLPPDAPDEGF